MEKSLKQKTVKGVGWSFADAIAGSGITFLVGLVLAVLLTPSEFGILGMVAIFIAISNSIVDSGFSSALIRKTDADDKDYNTVFIFNLAISILLYAVLFFSAPYISLFFKESALTDIMRVIGLVLIFNALCIIQRTLLNKSIDFKTQTKVSVIASAGSGVIGIGMALLGFGVWSLVAQQLSRQVLNAVFFWVFNRWRPTFVFSKASFKELFGFGSRLMISGIIDTTYQNIYYFVIGKFYTSAQLGQYARAEQFKAIFSQNLTAVVQRVSYPVLSSIQSDEERLLNAYRKVIKITMLVTFALMIGMAAVAKPMILILIGKKWLPAVVYLQIMCFAAMLYPLHAINLNILNVKGRSDLYLKLEVIKKILAVFPILLGIFAGIEYLLLGGVVISFVSFFLNSRYAEPLINYPTMHQIKDILPTFVVSLCIGAIMWGFTFLNLNNWIIISMQVSVGTGIAFVVYEKLNLSEYREIKEIATLALRKLTK